MKFFTRAWCEGKVDESEDRGQMYVDHLAGIKSQFSPTLRALAFDEFPLHDGLIRQIIVSRQSKSIQLLLRCGDRQMGYFDLNVSYFKVDFKHSDVSELASVANHARTEILYDEIDLHNESDFEHRFIFWPTGEAIIVFREVTFEMNPASGRDFVALPKRFSELT